jgi:hypothetical protein
MTAPNNSMEPFQGALRPTWPARFGFGAILVLAGRAAPPQGCSANLEAARRPIHGRPGVYHQGGRAPAPGLDSLARLPRPSQRRWTPGFPFVWAGKKVGGPSWPERASNGTPARIRPSASKGLEEPARIRRLVDAGRCREREPGPCSRWGRLVDERPRQRCADVRPEFLHRRPLSLWPVTRLEPRAAAPGRQC